MKLKLSILYIRQELYRRLIVGAKIPPKDQDRT